MLAELVLDIGCVIGAGDVFGDGIFIGISLSPLDVPWTSSIVYNIWSDDVKYGVFVEEHR